MGKALFYCFKCSRLIREDELETGRAFRIGDRVACENCAKSIPGAVPARPATPPAFHRPRSSSQRVPVPPNTPRSGFPAPPARPSVLPYIIVGGIALLLVIVIAVASSGRSRGGGAPPPPPRPEEPAPR